MSDLGISALFRAVDILKGQAAVARLVGTTQPNVHYALNKSEKVPAEWCIPIDLATAEVGERVSCHQLRPDLWPSDFQPQREAA